MNEHPLIEIAQKMNLYIRATQGNAGLHLPKVVLTIDTTVYYVQEVNVERDAYIALSIWDTETRSSGLTLPVESPTFHRLMKIVGIPGELQEQVLS